MNRLKEWFTDEEKAQLKSLRSSLAREELFDFGGMQFHPARLRGGLRALFPAECREEQEAEGAVPEEAGRAAAVQDRKGVLLPDRQEEGRGPGQWGVASFGAEADGVLIWALSS